MVLTRYAKGRFSIIGICLLPALIFCNCASTRILTLNQEPGCETSIEGYYHCAEPWDKSKPAIIIRQGMDMKIIAGEIVTQDDKGVTFDPGREGYIRDPKPEYFRFDKIEALIGENGEILYGSIPAAYSRAYALELHLAPQDNPKSKSIVLLLEPNERFGFCVPPGSYIISEMRFRSDYRKMIDAGVDIPKLTISVAEKKSNYIGDLYMDCGDEKGNDPIVIPYKIFRRPSDQGEFIAGALGGGLGGGIYAASKVATAGARDPKGIVGEHKLFIKKNDSFTIKGVSPKIDSIIN